MEKLIKSLSLSNATICDDDLLETCMKIIDWINRRTTNCKDIVIQEVEHISKSVIYLHSCYQMFEDLPVCLKEQYPFYNKQIDEFFRNDDIVANVFEKIASREASAKVIMAFETISNTQRESPLSVISLESNLLDLNDDSEYTRNRLKIQTLLQKILQLPPKQVDLAFERILENIPFDIIGLILCEPSNSLFSDVCIILADKLFKMLSETSISQFFIYSLYLHTTTAGQKGKQFFQICLKNEEFSNAIIKFFLTCLTDVFTRESNFYELTELGLFKKHKISHILYLVWCALSPQSPCHNDLHDELANSNVACIVFNTLSKLDAIFE